MGDGPCRDSRELVDRTDSAERKDEVSNSVEDRDKYHKWDYIKNTNDNGLRRKKWKVKVGIRDRRSLPA